MKKTLIFSLIILLLIPFSNADWFYNSRNVLVNVDIKGEAEIRKLAPNGYIDTATINLTFFPKEYETQELLNFDTSPEAEVTDKAAKYTWKRPENDVSFGLDADVKTINVMPQIREKIGFPIGELPEDIVAYTKPSETIDAGNDGIIRIASELVAGEDDLYAAVFKIAGWTKNNIEYNLSTLTAEVSQKASWVLENRQGVCDELTSLFIAMLRAVGIPARFVSGVAYTNSPLFPENWGPHGWAEVYFPNYGWVPFDVTYGEFGWVDPSHIKFKETIDSDEPSTYYQWTGRNADLEAKKLDIKTELTGTEGLVKAPISIKADVFRESVKFGSYNLLEVLAENTDDFYYATELQLSKPKEVGIIGDQQKSVLLLPGERKKLFWILKLDANLDSRYSYTFPLVVSTTNNVSSAASFASSIREIYVSLEEAEEAAKLLEEEKEKKYSGSVVLECRAEKSEFYQNEDVKLNCTAKNTGNVFLDDISVCFENECKGIELGISQAKHVTFDVGSGKIGAREAAVTLRNELVSKAAYVSLRVNDFPKIEIEDLEYPANVSYDENFSVSFSVAKKSFSIPKNVKIVFSQNYAKKEWRANELEEDRKVIVNIEGRQLRYGKNNYEAYVDYEDASGKKYSTSKKFSINLGKATLFQRLLLSPKRLDFLSHEAIAIILLTGTVAFIGVVLILFRRSKGH